MNYCCRFSSPVGGLFAVDGQRVSTNRTIPPCTLCRCYVLPEFYLCVFFVAVFGSTLCVLRTFEPLDGQDWNYGRTNCNKNFSHLVTVHNRYDVKLFKDVVEGKSYIGAYLGLHKNKDANPSEWSNGDEMTNWTTTANITHEQICVAIDNNTWTEWPCNETKSFMCYNKSKLCYLCCVTFKWLSTFHQ